MADLDDMLDEVANEQFKAPVKKQVHNSTIPSKIEIIFDY